VQSSDVFQGRGRLEQILVRPTTPLGDPGWDKLFEATDVRVEEAIERIQTVENRLDAIESIESVEPQTPVVEPMEQDYVVLFSTSGGYRLAEASGPLPGTGDRFGEDGVTAEVLRVGRSPLPGDRRPCVFALAC
jgi:hypothetical protein